jgi:hypothetical protein
VSQHLVGSKRATLKKIVKPTLVASTAPSMDTASAVTSTIMPSFIAHLHNPASASAWWIIAVLKLATGIDESVVANPSFGGGDFPTTAVTALVGVVLVTHCSVVWIEWVGWLWVRV